MLRAQTRPQTGQSLPSYLMKLNVQQPLTSTVILQLTRLQLEQLEKLELPNSNYDR